MEPERQYIINVGSVGQPRDGINDAAYALFDTEENYVHLVRVPYDIQSAQKKILDAGLPEFLAERIQYGR
jgi:diadenosine tetraphosphatase ApaH/serine/threonine PP2A family protein phosphatase